MRLTVSFSSSRVICDSASVVIRRHRERREKEARDKEAAEDARKKEVRKGESEAKAEADRNAAVEREKQAKIAAQQSQQREKEKQERDAAQLLEDKRKVAARLSEYEEDLKYLNSLGERGETQVAIASHGWMTSIMVGQLEADQPGYCKFEMDVQRRSRNNNQFDLHECRERYRARMAAEHQVPLSQLTDLMNQRKSADEQERLIFEEEKRKRAIAEENKRLEKLAKDRQAAAEKGCANRLKEREDVHVGSHPSIFARIDLDSRQMDMDQIAFENTYKSSIPELNEQELIEEGKKILYR